MCMRVAMHEALATVMVISCEHTYIDVCTCVRVRACVCTCVCVCACVHKCCIYMCVHNICLAIDPYRMCFDCTLLQYVDALRGCREGYIDVCSSSSSWYTEEYLFVVVTTGKSRCNRVPCLV